MVSLTWGSTLLAAVAGWNPGGGDRLETVGGRYCLRGSGLRGCSLLHCPMVGADSSGVCVTVLNRCCDAGRRRLRLGG